MFAGCSLRIDQAENLKLKCSIEDCFRKRSTTLRSTAIFSQQYCCAAFARARQASRIAHPPTPTPTWHSTVQPAAEPSCFHVRPREREFRYVDEIQQWHRQAGQTGQYPSLAHPPRCETLEPAARRRLEPVSFFSWTCTLVPQPSPSAVLPRSLLLVGVGTSSCVALLALGRVLWAVRPTGSSRWRLLVGRWDLEKAAASALRWCRGRERLCFLVVVFVNDRPAFVLITSKTKWLFFPIPNANPITLTPLPTERRENTASRYA